MESVTQRTRPCLGTLPGSYPYPWVFGEEALPELPKLVLGRVWNVLPKLPNCRVGYGKRYPTYPAPPGYPTRKIPAPYNVAYWRCHKKKPLYSDDKAKRAVLSVKLYGRAPFGSHILVTFIFVRQGNYFGCASSFLYGSLYIYFFIYLKIRCSYIYFGNINNTLGRCVD